ncbi:hypothetical protein [Streptomyces sp. NPDC001719]
MSDLDPELVEAADDRVAVPDRPGLVLVSPGFRLRVIGFTVPAVAADFVRGEFRGFVVRISHSTRS